MSAKLNVLIPDGDSTWAMAVIHCLCKIKDYRLFVLSNKKRTPSKYSRYTYKYSFVERTSDQLWLDVINTKVKSYNIDIIIPIAENEIMFFIENRLKILDSVKLIPMPKISAFKTASNKRALSEFCDLYKIPHPKSILTDKPEIDTLYQNDISFPILIKPLDQKGGDGIVKVNNPQDYEAIINRDMGSMFIQEFIEGYDIDCSVLCHEGNILSYTIQRGNLKGHNDFAPQLGFDLYDNPDVLSVVNDVMSALNWSGIAHVDLRYDEKSNRYCIIEINPRFWGSIGASLNAGVNFPHLSIELALHNTVQSIQFNKGEYMRLKGVIKTIKRRPGFIFKRNYMLERTEAKSFLNDPMPTVYRFIEWSGRKLKRNSN
ncbi:ATP-grasp domain-containing protein [Psychroserpens sp.]|uniref:ATP-grasp domain-containing protein n=1 Tax=Psychroserpens sp. TaxID=2020870 RepID=UPI001B1D588B|nr:ATP-grasp domain-containing protein [Psychroserpens sp.]MBO6606918.1 ATP-grasp domain-containing protein [Psychroserpens sp.]MBO6631704.1 ATP-grasp domain-containing protein [Psychroserpens sp.]MBO6654064.1 ATP-grasp domain-containing protein [Psychroserpens sp.]MBO6682650.1 ATP-grasp domain-containing protein [Psychroserpens sp.]MBO6750690.1 ATP-grasp domain-containing protein [Psychroserpens sp.]